MSRRVFHTDREMLVFGELTKIPVTVLPDVPALLFGKTRAAGELDTFGCLQHQRAEITSSGLVGLVAAARWWLVALSSCR